MVEVNNAWLWLGLEVGRDVCLGGTMVKSAPGKRKKKIQKKSRKNIRKLSNHVRNNKV